MLSVRPVRTTATGLELVMTARYGTAWLGVLAVSSSVKLPSPLASLVLTTVAESTGGGEDATVEVSVPVVELLGFSVWVTVVLTVSVSEVPLGGAGAVNVQVTDAAGARF